MAAEAKRAPRVVRDQMTAFSTHPKLRAPTAAQDPIAAGIAKLTAAIEPWYDWGIIHVERMQEVRLDAGDRVEVGGDGPVRFFQLQWFGLHLGFQIGRTPKAAL